jgi:hypothetical protein
MDTRISASTGNTFIIGYGSENAVVKRRLESYMPAGIYTGTNIENSLQKHQFAIFDKFRDPLRYHQF